MKSLARDGESDAGRATRGGSSATVVSARAGGTGAQSSAPLSATSSATSSAVDATADAAVTATGGSPDGTGTEAPPDATGSAGCWLVLMTQTLRPATDSKRHTIDHSTRALHHFERTTHDRGVRNEGNP
jgi:hypothetical protein